MLFLCLPDVSPLFLVAAVACPSPKKHLILLQRSWLPLRVQACREMDIPIGDEARVAAFPEELEESQVANVHWASKSFSVNLPDTKVSPSPLPTRFLRHPRGFLCILMPHFFPCEFAPSPRSSYFRFVPGGVLPVLLSLCEPHKPADANPEGPWSSSGRLWCFLPEGRHPSPSFIIAPFRSWRPLLGWMQQQQQRPQPPRPRWQRLSRLGKVQG